jgi:hypothetical protein
VNGIADSQGCWQSQVCRQPGLLAKSGFADNQAKIAVGKVQFFADSQVNRAVGKVPTKAVGKHLLSAKNTQLCRQLWSKLSAKLGFFFSCFIAFESHL